MGFRSLIAALEHGLLASEISADRVVERQPSRVVVPATKEVIINGYRRQDAVKYLSRRRKELRNATIVNLNFRGCDLRRYNQKKLFFRDWSKIFPRNARFRLSV
jgi:hypothetical protein